MFYEFVCDNDEYRVLQWASPNKISELKVECKKCKELMRRVYSSVAVHINNLPHDYGKTGNADLEKKQALRLMEEGKYKRNITAIDRKYHK